MNNIKDYENLSGKRVLLRLDLNVPLKNGDIVDETRIIKIIPVIEFLIKRNSKILIVYEYQILFELIQMKILKLYHMKI